MNPRPSKELSPEDCRVLDLLAEGGFDPAGLDDLDEADRARGEAITTLLGTLNQYPVEDASPELVDATLARIQREEDQRPQRMNIEKHLEARNDRALGGRRWRFPDLFATAAVVLIAVAVMWPITNTVHQRRMVDLDSANMSENGRAMALYAGANNGSSPMQATWSCLSVSDAGDRQPLARPLRLDGRAQWRLQRAHPQEDGALREQCKRLPPP